MRNGGLCCDTVRPKKVTGDKFRLTDDPNKYYHCPHYNWIRPYRKVMQITGILIWGQI